MINFTVEELEEILRTFKYGSYPSSFYDDDQPERRKSIKTKILKELNKWKQLQEELEKIKNKKEVNK